PRVVLRDHLHGEGALRELGQRDRLDVAPGLVHLLLAVDEDRDVRDLRLLGVVELEGELTGVDALRLGGALSRDLRPGGGRRTGARLRLAVPTVARRRARLRRRVGTGLVGADV